MTKRFENAIYNFEMLQNYTRTAHEAYEAHDRLVDALIKVCDFGFITVKDCTEILDEIQKITARRLQEVD